MNVNELIGLTEWIQGEVVNEQIPQKYQQLQALLQQNTQPNQQSTQFDSQKEDLLTALRAIHTTSLSNDQVTFLSKLGIGPLVGDAGAAAIEDILYRNAIDVATAAKKIAELTQILNEGVSKSAQISEGLAGLVVYEDEDVADGVLMRVSFLGDASMNNVADFKKFGDNWYHISRGITQAHNKAPEDIKVVGAAKGSVIIELLADPVISGTVASIIWGSLKVAEKVLNLKKIAAETRILNLQEKKLAGEIDKAADKEKSAGISGIVAEQIKVLKLKKATDGDKITALEKSVTELVNFINDGGGVDFVAPEEELNDEDEIVDDGFAKIRKQAEDIRCLENKLQLLEDKSVEVEDD